MDGNRTTASCLRIADLTIAVSATDQDLGLRFESPRQEFLVDEGNPDVKVRAAWSDLSVNHCRGERVFDTGSLWQLYREAGRYLFRFVYPPQGPTPYMIALFDLDFARGDVLFHRPHFRPQEAVDVLEHPLDELLMTNLLARGRGLMVHACGMVDSTGDGHLFVGHSKAGKTTLARLLQEVAGATILSDERIILRSGAGAPLMYGTPWHSDGKQASPAKAPLKRLFFLRHALGNERRLLDRTAAAARLLSCSFIPYYDRSAVEFSLGFCEAVTKAVPCYDFGFVPDESVAEFLRQEAA